MLFPIDVIVAVIYHTLIDENREQITSLSNGEILLWTVAILVLCLTTIEIATQLISKSITCNGRITTNTRDFVKQTDLFFRAVLVMVYIVIIESASWPGTIPKMVGVEGSELAKAFIDFSPYIILFFISRFSFLRLENIISPGKWKAKEYVFFKVRTTLFIIIPWFCMWVIYDFVSVALYLIESAGIASKAEVCNYFLSIPFFGLIVSIFMLIPVLVFFPLILVKIWQCKKLEDSPLREKIKSLERKAGVGFSQIYVWKLGGLGFINGAVIGFIKPFRFLLLSEGLLASLTESEICGVVGHELGHVKHRHLIWYLIFTSGFISIATFVLENTIFDIHLLAISVCIILAGYIRIVFGFVSRRFERQADLFGMEIMDRAEPLANSLEKIGFLNGGIRDVKSWHHKSIAERVDFLYRAEGNPYIRVTHHQHCRRVKLIGICIIVAGILLVYQSTISQPEVITKKLSSNNNLIIKHKQLLDKYFPEDKTP